MVYSNYRVKNCPKYCYNKLSVCLQYSCREKRFINFSVVFAAVFSFNLNSYIQAAYNFSECIV